MYSIRATSVSKSYCVGSRTHPVLHDVSLHIPAGACLGIVGPSGAGKSTLIRMFNGLEQPDTGHIQVGPHRLDALSPPALRRLRYQIGMVFQHYPLVFQNTVADNVAIPLRIAHTPADDIPQRVHELLELVGLTPQASQYPHTLSGGQMQRVAIARALACNPDVLLADEMTSALDVATTQEILSVIQSIQAQRALTWVVVTHDLQVARALCHDIAFLDRGRLLEVQPVESFFRAPRTPSARDFLGLA